MAGKTPIQVIKELSETEAKVAETAEKKQTKEFLKLKENATNSFDQALAKAPGLSAPEIRDVKAILPAKAVKPAVTEEIAPAPEPE
jgi:hypothetical protein